MKSQGSVLIVVLGLLAILAVVGVTFVTMSNIDRSTATNFAVQSQFMLAADGAVDYVIHHLIQDLWEYDVAARKYKSYLLTGDFRGSGQVNEPYDYPGPEDAWLATSLDEKLMRTDPIPMQFSFQVLKPGEPPYSLQGHWGIQSMPTDRPNNLGYPDNNGRVPMFKPGNGVWIPELSFPFETGLIRVSVTVQDHNAMLNLNAHGNTVDESERFGAFVSDLWPIKAGFDSAEKVKKLLDSKSTYPGRWADDLDAMPGFLYTAMTVIENPAKYGDSPFSLEEELELRRLTGTEYTSRLEDLSGNELKSSPNLLSDTTKRNRLIATTVSWTSEVRPDAEDKEIVSPEGDWSPRKIDLNLDRRIDIYNALIDNYVFDKASNALISQFVANIHAFRDHTSEFTEFSPGGQGGGKRGARRQPFFTQIDAKKTATSTDPDTGEIKVTFDVRLELYNPWPGPFAGDTSGLPLDGMSVVFSASADPMVEDEELQGFLAAGACRTITRKVVSLPQPVAPMLSQVLKEVRLTNEDPALTLDIISGQDITSLEKEMEAGLHRPVGVEEEERPDIANKWGTQKLTVLYVKDWESPGGAFGSVDPKELQKKDRSAIPIRFPHSVTFAGVDATNKERARSWPLPLIAETGDFKAFARVGDLNQVLCPASEAEAADFWPWIPKVARAASAKAMILESERRVKFDWDDGKQPQGNLVSRLNAANVFCVDGPWRDGIDNDGDTFADEAGPPPNAPEPMRADYGTGNQGRVGGPELRVAGKINLNTASEACLEAIEEGLGKVSSGKFDLQTAVTQTRQTRPLRSPAEIIRRSSGYEGDDTFGRLEERDLLYTRISNIATVRSDTFSIYGTVQYIDPTAMKEATTEEERFRAVRRSRRFWALVDRSPSLAYWPENEKEFIRPYILNFQWLD